MAAENFQALSPPLQIKRTAALSATIGNAREIQLPPWCKLVYIEIRKVGGTDDAGSVATSGTDEVAIGTNIKTVRVGQGLLLPVVDPASPVNYSWRSGVDK